LCNFFFLPLLVHFEKIVDTRDRATAPSPPVHGGNEDEFGTFTHNFLDDTCIMVVEFWMMQRRWH
jgi:hypothetical protein